VWRWDQQEPFGNNVADENPSGLGAFDLPLRLPGQYFDRETNLYYNYFRDYDPSIGRYEQSDPIGLLAGLNTYAYVAGDPLRRIDTFGLLSQGEADYLGGLGGKAAGGLADQILKLLGNPDAAGQDAAAELCGLYQGRRPLNLWSDCTTACLSRLEKLTAVSKAASGWLAGCTESCEKYFPRCNNKKTSLACLF